MTKEIESAVVKKLEQCGHKLGFSVRKDWKLRYGMVDLVWLKGFYRPLPGLTQHDDLPVVAFEIESNWQTAGLPEADSETTDWKPTKDVTHDLDTLIDSKAPLAVLVLCKGPKDTKQAIDRTKKAIEQHIHRQWRRWQDFYLALVWDEDDVEKLYADYDNATGKT
jgi:hypothetical protein